ncbi:unnamed protein product, partial [Allacma fusca]
MFQDGHVILHLPSFILASSRRIDKVRELLIRKNGSEIADLPNPLPELARNATSQEFYGTERK